MLELVREKPDWLNALGVALTRPTGTPRREAVVESTGHTSSFANTSADGRSASSAAAASPPVSNGR